ncbi:50S ribosomal protein L24 [soil metagenome]
MGIKLRKDDLVEVIRGNDRAKKSKGQSPVRGRVLSIDKKKGTVVVEGVNFRTRHEKVQQSQDGRSGGLVEREAPIHISNVAIVDAKADRPARIGTKIENGKRTRVTRGKKASGNAVS